MVDSTHPERIVPDEAPPGIVALHLKRYEFALPHAAGKRVLDAACGVGYGTAHLASRAREVVGIDVSDEAIAIAEQRYAAPNVSYRAMDVCALDFADASFELVCSFETIEHLEDPWRFVAEAARVLADDGVLVASTPRVERTTTAPENPFHRVEFSAEDFRAVLEQSFAVVELYGQRRRQTRRHRAMQRLDVLGLRKRLVPRAGVAERLLGTAPMAAVSLDEIEIAPGDLERSTEVVAVCHSPRRA